jgi:hypothetical protein
MFHSELNVGWCNGGPKGAPHGRITGIFNRLAVNGLRLENCREKERTRHYIERMVQGGNITFADVWAFGVSVWLRVDRLGARCFLNRVRATLESNKQ